VTYEQPGGLANLLLGGKSEQAAVPDAKGLASAATPRLWYLAPQSELAGLLTATNRK
jgi:hypothetical protein